MIEHALFALVVAGLMVLTMNGARAKEASSVFAPDFTELCPARMQRSSNQWQISKALPENLWASRITCATDPSGERVLRITVHPGDAANPNPGHNSTERVEIQVRREIVRIDEPIWYSFRFRLVKPCWALETAR